MMQYHPSALSAWFCIKIINIAGRIVKKGKNYFVFGAIPQKSVDKCSDSEYHTHCKEQGKSGIKET